MGAAKGRRKAIGNHALGGTWSEANNLSFSHACQFSTEKPEFANPTKDQQSKEAPEAIKDIDWPIEKPDPEVVGDKAWLLLSSTEKP